MALKLRFELTLKMADGLPRPNARLWLDLSQDYDLGDHEEITLTSVDREVWIGVLDLDEHDSADGLFFLLRFVAPEGTEWHFVAKHGDVHLYKTSDGLVIAENRESLTGYLSSPKAPRRGLFARLRGDDEDGEEG